MVSHMNNNEARAVIDVFEKAPDEKGQREWMTFRAVEHDKVAAFDVLSSRSTYAPRYVNIVHINRYRTT